MDFSQHLLKITFNGLSEKNQDAFWKQHVHNLSLDFIPDYMDLCVICKYISNSEQFGLTRECVECDKCLGYICNRKGCFDSFRCSCGDRVCNDCISNGTHVHTDPEDIAPSFNYNPRPFNAAGHTTSNAPMPFNTANYSGFMSL